MSDPHDGRSAALRQEPRISVAMCTYNGEKYLSHQLASILSQTLRPIELVVCDDKSSDGTRQIIEAFASRAPFPVHLVENLERLGSTKNFEKAIGLCSGDLIALSDQDDAWYPEKLQTLSSILHSDADLGGVFSDGDLVAANGESLGVGLWESFLFDPKDQEEIMRGSAETVLFRRTVVTGATLVFRSSLRKMLLPFPESWVHDAWLAWMLSLNSKLGICSKKLIAYRIHPSQQIGAPISRASFLVSISREGASEYCLRMKRKHIADYHDTSKRFRDLSLYLQQVQAGVFANLMAKSAAKARFADSVAKAMAMPRLVRLHRILRQAKNYFEYSPRPVRFLIRDMIL